MYARCHISLSTETGGFEVGKWMWLCYVWNGTGWVWVDYPVLYHNDQNAGQTEHNKFCGYYPYRPYYCGEACIEGETTAADEET